MTDPAGLHTPIAKRIGVLFMQSQAFFGADSSIHAQLMRHFDRSEVEVHVACTTEEPWNPGACAIRAIREIPEVLTRPTFFGPSVHGVAGSGRVRRAAQAPRLVASLLSLAAYIRRNHIRVIHCTEKPRDAFYGVLLGKLTGAKSVIHMHVGYEDWLGRTVKWALGQADAIIAISDFVADSLAAAECRRDRVFVVHNSLDLASWDPTVDASTVRRELGLSLDAPVVGIISRLFRWKGHSYLLDALADIKRDISDVRLVIVGEDDPRAVPGSGSYRTELEAQVQQLGLERNVLFTGFRTDVPRLMAALDVFVHPSWEEPFGMVFLEAMAMRKPVVAWESGGAPEVVVHGETGLLVERGSVAALADGVRTLLRDEPLRRRMGDAGRRRVEHVFIPERMCEGTLGAYRTTLHEGDSGRDGCSAGGIR
jgi:glycosyltransferase involved in cell wall biosynthesis